MESTPTFERHYTPAQLADLWGYSARTIRRMFEREPGVIGIGHPLVARKRKHISIRIPESVAQRIYRRLQVKKSC